VSSGLFSFSFVVLWLPCLRLVSLFRKSRIFTGEVTASVENENNQQDLQNCTNEAAFSNCNAEGYSIDKDVQTETDTMDIDALVKNFKESQKEREEEEEEEENDIVLK
jgi:hypothetical protein